ncbi:MAG TPA: carbamoylphosphate synthase large subunit [Candidatus Angelobacter sp.]|nr:carbamoylphosphate synthase large subunit [Candidatus Angelobacter sp.]
MARILITGGRAPAALDLARQFHRSGHVVFAADSAPWMLCGASRAIAKSYRLPEPKRKPHEFAAEVARICGTEAIDLIIPTCEEVFYLGRFKDDLEAHARVFCPGIEDLHRLHSKWEFATLVRETGGFGSSVRSPDSWRLTDAADIRSLPEPPEKLVFKPVYSRFAVETMIRPDLARAMGVDIRADRPWIAQSCILGREFCSYAVARDGIVRAQAIYEPTWRAGKGAGIYFEPRSIPAIDRFVAGLARHFDLSGQIAFDFIADASGELFVIECNPRATSGVHLFDGDLAPAFLPDSGLALRPIEPRPTPRMVASAMIPFGALQALRGGHVRSDAARLCRDFGRARDVIWSWRDPYPAFYALVGAAAFSWKAMQHRVSATAATTLDIAWDGGTIG